MLLLTSAYVVNGQVVDYRFRYSEKIVANYSGVLSQGQTNILRADSTTHEGSMELQMLDDSVVLFRIITKQFYSSVLPPAQLPVISGTLFTNSRHQVTHVKLDTAHLSLLPYFRMWLSELYLSPVRDIQSIEESRPDGQFSLAIDQLTDSSQLQGFQKSRPRYMSASSGKVTVIHDRYQWKGWYSRQMPVKIYFNELKRQAVSRKVLACVRRDFLLERMSASDREILFRYNEPVTIELHPVISAASRTRQIARNLLRRDDTTSLFNQLEAIDQLNTEQRFRLKSKFRSLLQLDPDVLKTYELFLQKTKLYSDESDILESAIIESGDAGAFLLIARWISERRNNYPALRSLIIKLTLANAFDDHVIDEIRKLADSTSDSNTKSLLQLAVSNYALTIREDKPEKYATITRWLMQFFSKGISDTAQYLYITGNAGIESAVGTIVKLFEAADSSSKYDIIYALRNIPGAGADSLLLPYLLQSSRAINYAEILDKRVPAPEFYEKLISKIIRADQRGDSTQLPALQFILDNTWQRRLNITQLEQYTFISPAYQREWADFRKYNMRCE